MKKNIRNWREPEIVKSNQGRYIGTSVENETARDVYIIGDKKEFSIVVQHGNEHDDSLIIPDECLSDYKLTREAQYVWIEGLLNDFKHDDFESEDKSSEPEYSLEGMNENTQYVGHILDEEKKYDIYVEELSDVYYVMLKFGDRGDQFIDIHADDLFLSNKDDLYYKTRIFLINNNIIDENGFLKESTVRDSDNKKDETLDGSINPEMQSVDLEYSKNVSKNEDEDPNLSLF